MKKYLLPIITVATLFVGQSLQAADGLVGRIAEISATSITINAEGSKKTLPLDAKTSVIGKDKASATVADLKKGYLVKVIPGASDSDPVAKIKIFKTE